MVDIHTIPILSVCQPYAHLIVHGPKRIENRTWSTRYRGWLGIHASKSLRYMLDAELHRGVIGDLGLLQFGAVIGVVRVVACVGKNGDRLPEDGPNLDWVFDDPWFEGPVGWVLESATPIEPITCRGKPGLFRI